MQSRLNLLGIQVKPADRYEADVNAELEQTISAQVFVEQQQKLDQLAVEIEELEGRINDQDIEKTASVAQLKRKLEDKQSKRVDLVKKIKFITDSNRQTKSIEQEDATDDFEEKIRKGILMPLDQAEKKTGSITHFDVTNEDEGETDDQEPDLSRCRSTTQDYVAALDQDDTLWESFSNRVINWKYYAEHVTLNADEHRFSYTSSERDKHLDESFFVPSPVYSQLFRYQKTGIRWLYALFKQRVGGILADEMGLGKTIQVIAFVAGLFASGLNNGKSVLIVCPVTLMAQWMEEFHKWFPIIPIRILHSQSSKECQSLRCESHIKSCVVITSYSFLQLKPHIFSPSNNNGWASIFLDEGHKIRNFNTAISQICRSLPCKHRIIISGTPIQNNLTELWALFDFAFPGRLGSHPIFQAEFEDPIKMGGYANASSLQVETAYKCSLALKSLISPFMLRRVKADVAAELPEKQEHILFCKLTNSQQQMYRSFLRSDDFEMIFSGKKHVLCGIDHLRKICNHLDLIDSKLTKNVVENSEPHSEQIEGKDSVSMQSFEKSGKFTVLFSVLSQWHHKHKVLVFCQTRQMLNIIEEFIKTSTEYSYLRMDGNTPVAHRNDLIARFNQDEGIFLFLLTTKVGGLGINLTGADRVVIYDPDWNPSTDIQARERAWRLGQNKPVMIFRLITVGTIEEKIYHRQIFKQFLTNKILVDPRQCRFFKSNDLYDLFSYHESEEIITSETSELFNAQEPQRDSILDTIASAAGIHSVFDHAGTMDKSYRNDYLLIRNEAEKIANSALETLRNSQRHPQATIGTVPIATKPVVDLHKTKSSNSLLQLLKPPSAPAKDDSSLLLEQIIAYLQAKQGMASTDGILDRFQADNIKPVVFKTLLQRVSTFDRSKKLWILRPEFMQGK